MARLKLLASALAIIGSAPANADPIDQWRSLIAEASSRYAVPESWIAKVMRAESRGDPRSISRKGAMGLMQLMPGTWEEMRAALGLGPDPYDPHDNVLAGTFYLKLMYDRFGYPGLFAAYNAGPRRYGMSLAERGALPRETRDYVAAVTGAPVPMFVIDRIGPKTLPSPRSRTKADLFFKLAAPAGR